MLIRKDRLLLSSFILIFIALSTYGFESTSRVKKNGSELETVVLSKELAIKLLQEMLADSIIDQSYLPTDYEEKSFNPTIFFSAKSIDLNRDGRRDLLITQSEETICRANNCPIWVFRATAKGYKLLISDIAGYNNPLNALNTYTNGYRDIRVQQHSSAIIHDITIYKFDGKKYKAAECYTEITSEDRNGKEVIELEPRKCDETESK